jgi:hypothetical protein
MKLLVASAILLLLVSCGPAQPEPIIKVTIIRFTPAHEVGSWWANRVSHLDEWILERCDTGERVIVIQRYGDVGETFGLRKSVWTDNGGAK